MLTDRRNTSTQRSFYRLVAWSGGIVAVMMMLISLWTYMSLENLIKSSRDRSIALLSAGMATSVSDFIVTRDYGALEAMLRHTFANEAIEQIMVMDLDGHVLVNLNRRDDDSIVLNFDQNNIPTPKNQNFQEINDREKGTISVWRKIDPGVSLGWLYVKVTTRFSDQILSHMRRNTNIFAFLIFVMTLGVVIFAIYFEVNKLNAVERALIQSNDELSNVANHDPLTKLPNRLSLEQSIASAIDLVNKTGGILAICFLDLDGFKQVNDQFGHKAGDMVLREVSNRLRNIIRVEDSVVRWGGDEFVLLLRNLATYNQVENLLNRVIEVIREPFQIGLQRVNVGISIGLTLFPFDTGSPSSLLSHADKAMYQAKLNGKNCWYLYESACQLDIPLEEA